MLKSFLDSGDMLAPPCRRSAAAAAQGSQLSSGRTRCHSRGTKRWREETRPERGSQAVPSQVAYPSPGLRVKFSHGHSQGIPRCDASREEPSTPAKRQEGCRPGWRGPPAGLGAKDGLQSRLGPARPPGLDSGEVRRPGHMTAAVAPAAQPAGKCSPAPPGTGRRLARPPSLPKGAGPGPRWPAKAGLRAQPRGRAENCGSGPEST